MDHPKFEKYIYRMFNVLWRWWPEKAKARKLAQADSTYFVCETCTRLFTRKETHVDHIVPKIPIEGPKRLKDGWLDLNELRRGYLVSSLGLQVLCKECHGKKTKQENEERRKQRAKAGTRRKAN